MSGDSDRNEDEQREVSEQLSLWLQNAPSFSIAEGAPYTAILNDLQGFDQVPSPVPLEGLHGCSDNMGQCSGSKRKFLGPDELGGGGGEEEVPVKTSGECSRQQQKKTRSSELHNLNERLRRQRLKEKIKALQDLIPNCNKRDKASTLDDAIKYIKTLQCQLQMMSMGAGLSVIHYPLMMAQAGRSFPPFPSAGTGMGYGMGMGMAMAGPSSSFNFPINQLRLPGPSLVTSGLPTEAHCSQNPGNVLPLTASCSMELAPLCAASSFPSSGSSQGASTSKGRSCQMSEQSSRGGSTARVLPTEVILPQVIKEAKDYLCSHSGSSEWATSSATKSEDSVSKTRKW